MKQVLTIVVKLQPTPEQVSKMDASLQAFANACNYVNDNTDPKITNKIALQALTYQTIKAEFDLVANMAVRACARVGANRKTAKLKGKPVKKFAPTSMDCDKDLFTFREKDWEVSLATVQGRERVRLNAGNYQRGKLKGCKPTSAQLCKHRDGKFYLHIQLKDEAPEPIQSRNVIGVDFGRRDIAVTSEGEKWDGQDIQQVRDKFSKVRASLQAKASKGTRSTRRRARQILQRLSGRERRYQQWLNHRISKAIVQQAKALEAVIAVEDLTGIRERTNELRRNKTERRRSNSWAFYQLRLFIAYKAIQAGVEMVAVNPAYTSQTCHQCLHIHPVKGKSYRSGKRFQCGHCEWSGDADLNGSRMIKILGLSVNQPRGSELACSLNSHASGLLKAPRSA
ncbi:transposase [Phormidesmis priestleyi ULC007]|uniref:Transposase n=1 Tax=Phormidesmis priestleyi ULC007 TaxID=1920490 RepID=A0A2T1DFH1_9CYAN|nr:RNA-guided endonuclease TnpB family protein [Phormidesmis priestleyi]PSB19242.1 transposase [Phormidesmis priestleyi ULC007]PZO48197.1 MAG: transposase [Phormidesmis priestleyi]